MPRTQARPHPAADPAEARVTAALDAVRAAGLRRTAARTVVLRVLFTADEHLSVADVVDRCALADGGLDFGTAWRTLLTLVNIGLVHTVHARCGTTYGAADRPHHHAVCESCGRTTELPADLFAPAVAAIEQASGFAVPASGLVAGGRCPRCRTGRENPVCNKHADANSLQ